MERRISAYPNASINWSEKSPCQSRRYPFNAARWSNNLNLSMNTSKSRWLATLYAASIERSRPPMSLYFKTMCQFESWSQKESAKSHTSASTRHFLSCHYPIAVMTTISNKVQALPSGEYLWRDQTWMEWIHEDGVDTFFPNVSPTNSGSISCWNWYLASHNLAPSCSFSSSPPPKPSSSDSWPTFPESAEGCMDLLCDSSWSIATKNSENGSYSSPENSHLWRIEKNGLDT